MSTLRESMNAFNSMSDKANRNEFIKRHLLNVLNSPSKAGVKSDDFQRCIENEIEYAKKVYDLYLGGV